MNNKSFLKQLFSNFSTKKSHDNAPTWNNYLENFNTKISLKTPLQDIRFVVVDTETTGLDYKNDKILSIGAIAVQNYQMLISDTWECFIQQDYLPSQKEVAIHGIRLQKTAKGIGEKMAMEEWLVFCKNSVLVAHHAAFDVAILNQALQKHFQGKMQNKSVDTAKLAIRLERGTSLQPIISQNYSLDALCHRYNITTSHRHTASGDAYMTALLFMKILARLEKRGLVVLGDLLR